MFPGHFAAGLGLKVAEPRASTLGLMIGTGFLDLLFGFLVMAGVEGGSFQHLRTPWSHSLLMAVVWSVLYGAVFWRAGARVAVAMGLAVFSHWVLDLLSHHPDMQLWPHSPVELGFGRYFGGLGGWLELLVSLLGITLYVAWARRKENQRRRWAVVAGVIAFAYVAEVLVVP